MTADEEALARVVRSLEELAIPYMVTGSVASSHHGRPRMTHDVDVVIDPSPESLSRLVERLASSGFHVDAARAQDALQRRRQFNVIETSSAMKIDLILRKDRPFSREELRRRQVVQLAGGTQVRLATPEDTILSKLEWAREGGGSERQLADVTGILDVHGKGLDLAYLDRWAGDLGVADLWRQVAGPRGLA